MTIQRTALIMGLGNPGLAYEKTRHNLGKELLQHFASKENITMRGSSKFSSVIGSKTYRTNEGVLTIHLAVSTVYMNESGISVKKICNYYKIASDQVLVLVDDIYLSLGKLRYREEGGSGGHNGLKSIASSLNTMSFPRLRLGIGQPSPGEKLEYYVLDKFKIDEMDQVENILNQGAEWIDHWLKIK